MSAESSTAAFSTPPGSVDGLMAPELDAWIRLGLSLLEAVTAGPVALHELDAESFRLRVAEASSGLSERPGAPNILIAAGTLTQTIRHYNAQTQGQLDALRNAQRAALEAVLDHLASIHENAGALAEFR